jgi:hypothetical protein
VVLAGMQETVSSLSHGAALCCTMGKEGNETQSISFCLKDSLRRLKPEVKYLTYPLKKHLQSSFTHLSQRHAYQR